MPLARMRPTFEIPSPHPVDASVARLRSLVDEGDHPLDGRIAGTHLMLVIPPARRHFWSPWLHLEVYEAAEGSSVQGRFSPNPSVWTGIMLAYIALCTLIFFASIFGFAQLIMQRSPWALSLLPVFLIVGGLIYWGSLVGQKLANDQMHELHDAVAGAIARVSAPDTEHTGLGEDGVHTVLPEVPLLND
ncbi:MAG: hypothetical protein KC996_05330 [Phycisphaerales bacterium]|nr:hypothetical protein [Phycisphaerales bacterium]